MSSLKAKLFTAAKNDAGLVALLGNTDGTLRWFDTRLEQQSAFPAVEVMVISNPRDYAVTGRLATSWARVQFTIFGSGADSENANQVAGALTNFLDSFNAIGIAGLKAYPNQIVGDREWGVAQTEPLTWQRIIDVQMFDNDLVN